MESPIAGRLGSRQTPTRHRVKRFRSLMWRPADDDVVVCFSKIVVEFFTDVDAAQGLLLHTLAGVRDLSSAP